jgi:nucleoside phosphorylase
MSSIPSPCVLFALPRERMFFHGTYRIAHRFACHSIRGWRCAWREHPVLVVETGVGVENTLRAVDWLLAGPQHDDVTYRPTFILFGGFAGALDESLGVADVVLAEEVINLDGHVLRASWPAEQLSDIRRGRLLTVNRFIGNPAEKLALGRQYGAIAVDMETAAFARRCAENNVPWGALRVISDDIRRPVSRDVAALVEDSRVSVPRLLKTLLRRPTIVPELWRLGRDTRRASRKLADGLIQWLRCSSPG